MEKQKLIVNCGICDTSNVSESMLEQYENITINASVICISPDSKKLLAKYPVRMNSSNIQELEEKVEVICTNGNFTFNAGNHYDHKVILFINGRIDIGQDVEAWNLENIECLIVNGVLVYPDNLKESLPPLRINGTTQSYPGDAVRLSDYFVVDRTFLLRAKGGKYYAPAQVQIIDTSLELDRLMESNTLFLTEKAIIAEELLEKALPLFKESTPILVIPSDYTFVAGNTELTEKTLRSKGNQLYVNGNLIIKDEGIEVLKQLKDAKVKGSICTFERLREQVADIITEYDDIQIIKGTELSDRPMVKVTPELLDRNKDGIKIFDCAMVHLDPELTSDQIEKKLLIVDCGMVSCNKQQRSSVEMVTLDVGKIHDSGSADDNKNPTMDFLGHIFTKEMVEQANTQVINTTYYEL